MRSPQAGSSTGAAAGSKGPTYCFPANVKVLTPLGLVNIQDIKIGDEVLAYDVDQNKLVVRPVEKTSQNWSDRLVELKLTRETISSTGSHPYWEEESRSWVPARELRPGMVVRLADGRTDVVRGIQQRSGIFEVYNFEVAGEHNYFVGQSSVLVHNGGPDLDFDDYNQARNAALKWLEARGFKAEKQVIGKFGPNAGKPIGMSTADGKVGFRVEYDARSGAHINVFDNNAPKGSQKGPHIKFKGTESMVNKIVQRFRCP